MPYNSLKHARQSYRLRGYDYSKKGAYSVTICTQNREHTLGDVVNGEVVVSEIGRIVGECWRAIPSDLANVALDEYIIMPDHMHGIVIIGESRDLMHESRSQRRDLINQITTRIPTSIVQSDWPLMKNPKQTLGKIIRHFKAKATKKIHDAGFHSFAWQGGYYDHIVRSDHDLQRIRQYIRENPRRLSHKHRPGLD